MMPTQVPPLTEAAILLHVLDYPGIGKVMGVVGSGGIQGCAFCSLEGKRSEVLHKRVYMQNRHVMHYMYFSSTKNQVL